MVIFHVCAWTFPRNRCRRKFTHLLRSQEEINCAIAGVHMFCEGLTLGLSHTGICYMGLTLLPSVTVLICNCIAQQKLLRDNKRNFFFLACGCTRDQDFFLTRRQLTCDIARRLVNWTRLCLEPWRHKNVTTWRLIERRACQLWHEL